QGHLPQRHADRRRRRLLLRQHRLPPRRPAPAHVVPQAEPLPRLHPRGLGVLGRQLLLHLPRRLSRRLPDDRAHGAVLRPARLQARLRPDAALALPGLRPAHLPPGQRGRRGRSPRRVPLRPLRVPVGEGDVRHGRAQRPAARHGGRGGGHTEAPGRRPGGDDGGGEREPGAVARGEEAEQGRRGHHRRAARGPGHLDHRRPRRCERVEDRGRRGRRGEAEAGDCHPGGDEAGDFGARARRRR
ncbi:hypothetical protein LTR16_008714, partial [Cryomyces antarcticus]